MDSPGRLVRVLIEWLQEKDTDWTVKLSQLGRRQPYRRLSRAVAHSGDSALWVAITVLLYLLKHEWREVLLIQSLAAAYAIVLVLTIKPVFGRQRPAGHEEFKEYRGPDKHSFPSGHVTRALALVVVFTLINPLFALIFLPWAMAVGLARVIVGAHWLSDVVIGGVIGCICGLLGYYSAYFFI